MSNLAPFTARLCRSSLVEALAVMVKIVEKKNTIPVLSCVLLEASADCVTVRGCDLDLWGAAQLPADCVPSRSVAVNCEALHKIAKAAKAETVTITDVGGAVTFRDGETGAAMRMPSQPAEDFPMPQGKLAERRSLFALPADELRSDIDRMMVAVSTEETRYYLNGIFWHRTADEYGCDVLRLAATDGHRLARITRPAPADLPEDFPDSILPRKTCTVLAALLPKKVPGASCYVGFAPGTGGAVFRFGRVELRSKMIDGTFPDYSRVIPSRFNHSVTLPADALADAAKGVTGQMTGRTRVAQFSWDNEAGWMTAFGQCADSGPAMMSIEGAEFTAADDCGGAYTFGVNATYLQQLLAKWSGPVTIAAEGNDCPMRIDSLNAGEYMQVLMPIRIDRGPIAPDYMDKLNRTPVELLNDDAPELIESAAALAADPDLTASAKRTGARLVNQKLAALAQAAIAHLVDCGKGRREARLVVLLKLAQLRGDDAAFNRLVDIIGHQPRSSFLAWERGITQPQAMQVGDRVVMTHPAYYGEMATVYEIKPGSGAKALTDSGRHVGGNAVFGDGWERAGVQDPAQDLAQIQTTAREPAPVPAAPEQPAPLPQPGEAAPVEPEPVAAGEKPMFRTLQDFKAMAGIGSRWKKSLWRDGAWHESDEGVRTVARVKARDIGFLRCGEYTAAEIEGATDAALGWFGFPKSGFWKSDAAGLIVTGHDGTPNIRFDPLPSYAEQYGAPPAPVVQPDGEADLRELVAAMASRLAVLESAAQSPAEAPALPDVEEPESRPAPALAENIGNWESDVGRNLGENEKQRAVGYLDGRAGRERDPAFAYSASYGEGLADGSGARALVDVNADTQVKRDRHIAELRCLIDELNADRAKLTAERDEAQANAGRAVASGIRMSNRNQRLKWALAGRKAQLARRGDELRFAHAKGAQLQRELSEAGAGQPLAPSIILPAGYKAA